MSDQNYCAMLVKDNDYVSYLMVLFAPDKHRRALYAVLAFNIELANIADKVSEHTLGQIRLAWWREAMDALFEGQVRAHPVLQEISNTELHLSSREELLAMISVREQEHANASINSPDGVRQFTEQLGKALGSVIGRIFNADEKYTELYKCCTALWNLMKVIRAVIEEVGQYKIEDNSQQALYERQLILIRDLCDCAQTDADFISKNVDKNYRKELISPLLFNTVTRKILKRIDLDQPIETIIEKTDMGHIAIMWSMVSGVLLRKI